ncbi:MAG: IMP dehydrogenase, partial [Chitinispirillia bacterium]
VDAYGPVIGSVNDVLDVTIEKIKSTMCNNGSLTLNEFHNNAVLTRISKQSLIEGGTPNVLSHDQIVSN